MQAKTVELQCQSKKQTGSPGKRQPSLCHQSSSARGIQGAQQECGVGRDFWLPAKVEQEGAITGIYLAGMYGRQAAKEGSPGEM